MSTTEMTTTTTAERQVIAALDTTTARTPAELKARMPGATPVATIRTLLGSLADKGLATTAPSTRTPGVTAWVLTEAGSPSGMRAATLAALAAEREAAQPEPERPAPARPGVPCDYLGCTTNARNLVRLADSTTVRLCQRHTLALGSRATIVGGVR